VRAVQASLALVAMLVLGAAPAWSGTANRAWVSGHGFDQAGCGAPTAPCRSLQYTHDHVIAAGGEIDILDPAGYGAIVITKAVSIVNDGVGTAGVQATSGNAITINAGAADTVFLRGLNIDGVQNAGVNGVVLNSGGALTLVDCVIRHFSHQGVLLAPAMGTSSAVISRTVTADNGQFGIEYGPANGSSATATLVIDGSIAANNVEGITLVTPSAGALIATITDTIASDNGSEGLDLESNGGTTVVKVDGAYVDHNQVGLNRSGPVTVHLSRSVIDQNTEFGVDNVTGAGGIFSAHDNHIDANATAISGDALLSDTLQ
jgi:hypothetical protein